MDDLGNESEFELEKKIVFATLFLWFKCLKSLKLGSKLT